MSLRTRVLGAGLTALAMLTSDPSQVEAQRLGTISLQGFGQFTFFDDQSTLTDLPQAGLGGGIGFFVLPNLALEAATSYTPTSFAAGPGGDIGWMPLRARLAFHIPVMENIYPIIGVGWSWLEYSDGLDTSEDAITGLLGLKTYLSQRWALRLDAIADHAFEPFNDASSEGNHLTWTLAAGLSLDLGPGRGADTDGDGVQDRNDACPATPRGASVDARGCRLDGDRDGVFNEADRCPNTPAGVSVDATGCRVDGDGDGVWDEDDRCPNTPAGNAVDATGCRLDGDGDGVYDEADRCPNTPAGAQVDTNGCRVDTDGDGVYDEADRCPNTPAGAQVGTDGCRRDRDGDGVFDEADRCPNTAAGVEVDAAGCPVLFADDAPTLILEGVNFETNSAVLTVGAQSILDRVAESLVGNPTVSVRVVGHTDNTGSRQYNVQLSQQRAEAVMAYLVSQGVAPGRLEAQGMGPDEPVASNATPEGRLSNRRVELVRTSG